MKNEVFVKRRKQLLKKIKTGVAIIPSAPVQKRSFDTDFPYRQDSNFYYLTGLNEASSILILTPDEDDQTHLFIKEIDPLYELWEGKMLGVKAAKKKLEVDRTYSLDKLSSFLSDRLQTSTIFIDYYDHHPVLKSFIDQCNKISRNKISFNYRIENIAHIISEQRMIKDSEEIKLLRESCKKTALAHTALMQFAKKGMNEGELKAYIEYEFFKAGADSVAYNSIIASGNNACTLHYTDNNMKIKNNDLILIDAGGEYDCYATDITRCFPIDSRFSTQQKEIYQIVLNAEKKAVKAVKPGKSFHDIGLISAKELAKGLKELRLAKGSIESIIKGSVLRKYSPHGLGHWMGIDVHDPGDYGYDENRRSKRKFKKGMVFTVEPGLYLNKVFKEVPKAFKGIGVRIEDNILVTSKGYENLTIDCPKEIKEIESLRS